MSLFNSHFLMFVAWVGAFDHQIWLSGKAFEHNFGLEGGGGGAWGGSGFEHANHQQFKCQGVAGGDLKFWIDLLYYCVIKITSWQLNIHCNVVLNHLDSRRLYSTNQLYFLSSCP